MTVTTIRPSILKRQIIHQAMLTLRLQKITMEVDLKSGQLEWTRARKHIMYHRIMSRMPVWRMS